MAEIVNLKQFGTTAKEQAETLVNAALGAKAKADVAVKVRGWLAKDIEESKDTQTFLGHLFLHDAVIDHIKKWMMDNNVKEIVSSDGTLKFTSKDPVYGYRPINDEEQKALDAHRAPVQTVSMAELMKIDPELAGRICDEAHRTKSPIRKGSVSCQDTRATLTELDEVCKRAVAIEECRRLYQPAALQ